MTVGGATFKWEFSLTTIAVIVGFVVQGAAFVWFLASLNSSVTVNSTKISALEKAVDEQRMERLEFSDRMARVETKLTAISEQSYEQRQLLTAILNELKTSSKK